MQSNTNIFQGFFQPSSLATSPLRRAITAAWRIGESEAVSGVLQGARVGTEEAARIQQLAARVARKLRQRKARVGRASVVQSLLQEYALSSQEGVALMCLAEALLRIPDAPTRDALIRDKISQGQWSAHLGQSSSLFVNAATWGLLITGKLVSTHSESKLTSALSRLVGVGGEPLIRKGVDMAMRMMGEQFVTGETIDEALKNGSEREQQGFRYSFDMLGEAALTARDAQRYLGDYENAIRAIGIASADRGVYAGPGISIKLSALHPRYSRAQYDRVMSELYPTLVRLCAAAKRYDIGLNIDAEEADRLELSLDLLEKLCFEPQLQGWNGLGFVIQGYQKRCPYVIDYLIDLARRSQRRLMIRLVKGAYWDSEIKRAQVDGLKDYPVYTRKPHTDAAYIACARKLLAAPDEVFPQFATHNAQTLATIYELADPARYTPLQYEFQCLHGMGEPLYEQVVGDEAHGGLGRSCRIYAPVGTHETLLAYLVRRLLENGANTSFVHQIADPDIAIETLVQDPVAVIERAAALEGQVGCPHPAIPLPNDLYGPLRRNSRGYDLASESELLALSSGLDSLQNAWEARPMLAFDALGTEASAVCNPAQNHDHVGSVRAATPQVVDGAVSAAVAGAATWASVAPAERAQLLELAADQLEANLPRLMSILIREAGKSASNAVAEVREAVDFLRYYAGEVRARFDNRTHIPLGPVVCISPWNFPLAIFVGQVAAALAAGNVVLAKPAEQTPLIAVEAVRALWEAGVPRSAVQLLPGDGPTVGAQLVADERVQGVLFTGSTEVARILQKTLAGRVNAHGRAIPLIAETGGQNAMIVDSSALAEQVVGDVLASAFDSAGQRCSALRVLCVQEEAADRVLDMLLGAMAELRVGSTALLQTDVGPVIDAQAQQSIEHHVESMKTKGHRVHRAYRAESGSLQALGEGTFVLPTLIEIDRIAELEREVFGPVLHFVRYKRENLDALMAQINATGYGLTMGLHTRIDETIAKVVGASQAGNVYVNRNMVGAVVGVQPFGGERLSGTGPKAGGPLYLYRLLGRAPSDVLLRVTDSHLAEANAKDRIPSTLQSLRRWAKSHERSGLVRAVEHFEQRRPKADTILLAGPTGERNVYFLHARLGVVCIAERQDDLLLQLAAVLAVGGQAIWPVSAQPLLNSLPSDVQAHVAVAAEPLSERVHFDAVLLHGTTGELTDLQRKLAEREGPVISVERMDSGDANVPLERLMVEKALSVNTAAAGGNASLMTIG